MLRTAERTTSRLAALAVEALIDEALLTPKPGLVDRRGSGAHHDLDLGLMLRSAPALAPTFTALADAARGRRVDTALRAELGAIGRAGERAMLAATGGINTHRGAIWSLGLIVAAAAGSPAGAPPSAICRRAGAIARLPDAAPPPFPSNGASACVRFAVGGARAEAAAGFPHVRRVGLPTLARARRLGASERCARIDALLAIMAGLDDTCLLHRGGLEALTAGRANASTVLAAGGSATAAGLVALMRLDRELVARHASPGGSADLLAATLLLDAISAEG